MPATPYMKLYIGDYLGDTSHLTTLQHGAYLLLIMAYWQKGGCVRNADAMLRQCTRTTPEEWEACREVVLEFFEDREGFLYHKRIDKELQKRELISNKSKDSAAARWSERNADAMRTQCGRNATPIVHSPDNIINNIPNDANAMRTHKHEYGAEKNVLLTDGQYSKLRADLGEPMLLACIEELSTAKAMKGYKYKRDDLAIRKWVIDAIKKKGGPPKQEPEKPRYSNDIQPVLCPVCGTNETPNYQGRCRKCGFFLEPSCMNDPELVAEYAEGLKAKTDA